MSTINRLSSVDVLQPSDQIPVWDSSNGDTRKASMSTLLAFVESYFADPDYSTRIVAPAVDYFTVDIGATGDSIWMIVNPTLNFTNGAITLPPASSAVNDQEITVVFTASVSTFVITSAGATVLGAPVQIGGYDSFRVRYNSAQLTWYTLDTTGDGTGSGVSQIVRQDFTGDGTTTTFTLTTAPSGLGNELQIFIDGVYQERSGYTVTGSNVIFSEAPPSLSNIEVLGWAVSIGAETSANLVSYTPAGTGAVLTTVQAKLRESVSVKDFGAVGDGVADDTAAIQAALTATTGKTLILEEGATYRCTSGLTAYGSIEGRGATFMFYGAVIANLIYTNSAGDLRNFTIDGTNVPSCSQGLYVDTNFPQTTWNYYNGLTIQNISNSDNTQGCTGALFVRSLGEVGGFFDININVFDITATPNTVIGDSGGAAAGILVSINNAGTDISMRVHDCVVKRISPSEDASGIHLLTVDHTTPTSKGWYQVENCEVYDSEKYSYKIQAPNVLVTHCFADNTNFSLAQNFTTYGHDVTYQDCIITNCQGEGFASYGVRTAVLNCTVSGDSNFASLRAFAGADDFRCDGMTIDTAATFSSNAFNRVNIAATGRVDITNLRILGTTNTGTAIVTSAPSGKMVLSNVLITGFEIGIQCAFSTQTLWIDNADIETDGADSIGINRTGSTANFIRVRNSRIAAAFVGMYCYSSGGTNACVVDVAGSLINSDLHGIFAAGGSVVRECKLESAVTTGLAVDVLNGVVRGCQITNFGTGISYNFTTTAEIANNVTIGTTTPYSKTGFTAFVDHDNYSR